MAAKLRKRDGYGRGGGLSLPEDIVLEVLLRLPARALCRFRCVSRSWRALISDPAFVAMLRSRATGTLIVAAFGHELRLLDKGKGGNVLMVCNVMGRRALLAPTRLDRIFVDRGQLGAMIIDPASGHDFTIVGTNDPPPVQSSWANFPVISDYSFGHATASGGYKVLRLATSSRSFHHPNRWCQVATIMDGGAVPSRHGGKGHGAHSTTLAFPAKTRQPSMAWHPLLHAAQHLLRIRKRIAAFDLESEEWKPQEIKGPLLGHRNKDDKWRITLTELKGTLCMVHNVQYLSDLVGHYANIWLLKHPNGSVWVKKYRIQMPERLLLFTKPLDVLSDGKLLLLNELRKAGNTKHNCHRYILQLYNSSTKAFTDFMEMAPGFNGEMAFYTGNLQA